MMQRLRLNGNVTINGNVAISDIRIIQNITLRNLRRCKKQNFKFIVDLQV